MLPLALALALAAGTADAADPAEPAVPPEDAGEVGEPLELIEQAPRLDLAVWGGPVWLGGGGGDRSEAYGGEAIWRFDALDLGLWGGGYRLRNDDGSTYAAPVWLVRLGQRFETRNGLLASFTFGAGAAKAPDWRAWFQVALGARATFGPVFVAGELSFESDDLMRLAFGIGVSLL